MPKIQTNGVSLYYEQQGSGEPLIRLVTSTRFAEPMTERIRDSELYVFDFARAGDSSRGVKACHPPD